MTYTAVTFLDGLPYPAQPFTDMSAEVAALSAAQSAMHSTLDALRVTTSGAYHNSNTDLAEVVKLRSASVLFVAGQTYRFHGQTLYSTGAEYWDLELHKGSTAGELLGGVRLEVSSAGRQVAWDVTWPCAATETTQVYWVANRNGGTGTLQLFGVQPTQYNTFSMIDRIGAAAILRDVA